MDSRSAAVLPCAIMEKGQSDQPHEAQCFYAGRFLGEMETREEYEKQA